FGRSTVQDHQTKGDQPFLALIARQLEVQAPTQMASAFAPNRGRKVLIFSDSRQVAARLAPTLHSYATQDLLRPLVAFGFSRMAEHPSVSSKLNLRDAYLAVLIGVVCLEVGFRPELKPGESAAPYEKVRAVIAAGALADPEALNALREDLREVVPPESLLAALHAVFTDGYYGMQALALGSLCERKADEAFINQLPALGTAIKELPQKVGLVRVWLSAWRKQGIWFPSIPGTWIGNRIKYHSGKFGIINNCLGSQLEKQFARSWLEP